MSLQPTFRRSILAVVSLATLCFGWYPFNFVASNDIYWAGAEGVLVCNPEYESGDDASRGLVYSVQDLDTRGWSEASVLVELRGRPRNRGLCVFLELFESEDQLRPPLLLAQWQDHVAIKSRRELAEAARGYDEIGYRNCFAGNRFVQVLLTRNERGTSLYIDGTRIEARQGFELLGSDGDFVGKLVIGNSADGTKPFTGEIRRVAIFDKAIRPTAASLASSSPVLDYRFDAAERFSSASEDGGLGELGLRRSGNFEPLKRAFFNPADKETITRSSYRKDIVVNTLGFIPFGLCLAAVTRRRFRSALVVAIVVALGSFGLSFLIEWGQGYLVQRDSSLLDLLLNTGSGVLALLVPKRWILFL